jgi:L-asparaginase
MSLRTLWLILVTIVTTAAGAPPVALIEDALWSPDDAPRDGAAELGVLLQVAQLRQAHSLVGLVGVGDRRGIFQDGTQRGLEFAVRQGIPVVRLARGVRFCPPSDSDLFIDGGVLSPEAAVALLGECLQRYGALPIARSSHQLTSREIRALREKLTLYQAVFTSRQPAVVALR